MSAAKGAAAQSVREAEVAGELVELRQAPSLPLMLVEARETEVCNTSRPRFHRAYAWYRLLRPWSSLMFDDAQGLPPHTLEQRARGVYGLLRRTKTSGQSKARQSLPAFVSRHAWVGRPWLIEVLLLWLEEGGGLEFVRNYFFVLPIPDR